MKSKIIPACQQGTGQRGLFSFTKENSPLSIPQEKGFRLAVSISNDLFASGMEMPARGDAAFRVAIRFASAPTIRCCAAVGGSDALRMRHTPCGCRSAHLVEVQTNLLLPTMHTVSIMRTAASEAMPLRQAIPGLIESEVERSYVRVMNRRQSDSEDRSKSNRLDIKQGRHLIRQALQFFELLACNGKRLSFGRATPVSFLGKENGGRIRAAPLALRSLRAARGKHLRPCGRKKRAPLRVLFFKSLRISRTGTSGRLRR